MRAANAAAVYPAMIALKLHARLDSPRRDREQRYERDAEAGGDQSLDVPLLSERKANSSE